MNFFINSPRVGFTLIGGKSWTGGYNYLINLLSILTSELPGALVPVLFVGRDIPESDLQPFRLISGCEVVQDVAFNADARSRVLFQSLIFGRDFAVQRSLHHANIDIVFEAAVYFGWRLKLPVIAWIPDLQHRALPQLFTRIAWIRRELGFRMQIWSGRFIMCSSFDTLREIKRLYPSTRHRVSAVRFAIKPPMSISDLDARAVANKYCLPEKFFFMPNQFWAHKNHKTVLKALQLAASKGHVLTILASGQQMDSRNINYAPKLLADIKAAGLHKHFITPGLLPYEDLAPLMRASSALINPSLFEGWSTTVEEARSAGVPMILSDIPVHREQAGENAVYFDPSSPEALANVLISFSPLGANEREVQIELAKDSSKMRVKCFAQEFFEIAQKTMERGLSS